MQEERAREKNLFNLEETVYIAGSGFAANQTYNIYTVNDTAWSDGMTIPGRVQGTATTRALKSHRARNHKKYLFIKPL